MSYRKKHYPAKPERETPTLFDVEYSNPGVDRTLPTSRLTSGLPYQRPVDEKEVDRLVREWDDRLLEPLTVSFRTDASMWWTASTVSPPWSRRTGGREVMVPCKVYSGLSYEEEAALCYKLDKAKRRLSLSQSTNALVESGMDAEATEIRRLIEEAGFRWRWAKKADGSMRLSLPGRSSTPTACWAGTPSPVCSPCWSRRGMARPTPSTQWSSPGWPCSSRPTTRS